MALNIKDPAVLSKLEHLSRVRRLSKVDVLRAALDSEMRKEAGKAPVRDLLAPLLVRVAEAAKPKHMDWDEEKRRSDELWGE